MIMKTPAFWYGENKDGLMRTALMPLSLLYRFGYEIHQALGRNETPPLPVICVGNVTAGGSGKTPAALAIMDVIKRRALAKNPFFLSRGYGGDVRGPVMLDAFTENVGDEALILARQAPTIVSANRIQGIQLAAHRLSDLIIMDDGLQNPHVKKSVSFMVVDGTMGFGNGKLLPAGPLREPLDRAFAKADAFIVIGSDVNKLPADKPIFKASIETTKSLAPGRYVAFAGIGYPEKFFTYVRGLPDVDIAETVPFPDHHDYSPSDIQILKTKAAAHGAKLVTTEKDAVKISTSENIETLKINLRWGDEAALAVFLEGRLKIA